MCHKCESGHHPLAALRRRLSDEVFEHLLELRDCAKTSRAASQAVEAARLRAIIDVD